MIEFSIKPLRRPWWLPQETWVSLLALYGNAPRCAWDGCDAITGLSVDHIVARKLGGSLTDLSNLQFLCIRHNSQKGIRADRYWESRFYWDQTPNLEAMRTAQRRVYEAVAMDEQLADWFAQPQSQIAGKLYLIAAVVAAGKTLAIPTVAFAYNQAQRRNPMPTRRADRILVLTKEQAIRDQLARDIRTDLTRFEIVPSEPRVAILPSFNCLLDDHWITQQDVVVACVQMFWDAKAQEKPGMIEALGKFPLICIDEPHYAADQVRKILDCAPRSVGFGFTGSPITRNSSLLNDFVKLTQYTYEDSHRYDRGVKYLSHDNVITVQLDSADLLVRGLTETINDSSNPDYDPAQLVPASQVVSRVIRKMEECDGTLLGNFAPHRDADDPLCIADLWYPAHAIIRCESRAMAKALCDQTNALFESNRKTYPRQNGWSAEYIFTDGEDIQGAAFNPDDHPWMRAYRSGIDDQTNKYECDKKSARILFVVGMAREGVSNPLCCVNASVDGKGSIVTAVQGHAGRGLRAVFHTDSDGVRHIPPAILDTAHLITHEAHTEAIRAINAGIDFILDMNGALDGLPTVADLMEGRAPTIVPDGLTADDPLKIADRIAIAAAAVSAEGNDWRDDPAAISRIIKCAAEQYAPENAAKASRISDWVTELSNDPERAWQRLGHIEEDALRVVPVVLTERERHEPSNAELREFINWNAPSLSQFMEEPIEAAPLLMAREMYKRWADDRALPPVSADRHIEDIRQDYALEVKRSLDDYLDKSNKNFAEFQRSVHKYVGRAVLRVLNVPQKESAAKDTKWDCPQVHIVLQRPDVRRAILGYARAKLIKDGWCPILAQAFGVQVDG